MIASMTKAKNDTNSIRFFWIPTTYKMRWAREKGFVPEWDVSRSYPLSVPISNFSAGVFELAEGLIPSEVGSYGMAERIKDSRNSVKIGRKAGVDNLELMRLQLLQVDSYTPHEARAWAPKRAPALGYPRLVRKSFDRPADKLDRTNEDVINEIGALDFYVDGWLKGDEDAWRDKKVLKLAQAYGAPFSEVGNTLEAWMCLAREIAVNLEAKYLLSARGFDEMLYWLNEKEKELRDKESKLHRHEHVTVKLMLLLAKASASMNARRFRELRAESLQATFLNQGEGLHMTLEGVVLNCSVGSWVCYQLAKMWKDVDTIIKRCNNKECKTKFVSRDKRSTYCKRGPCAGEVFRKKRAEKSSIDAAP